jgi:hypothetical protein
MAHEVRKLPGDAARSVFDSRIQRILSVTAAYYGLVPALDVSGVERELQV